MFVALDQFGKKLNPLDVEEEELRLLSRAKLLYCPGCKGLLRFASGEQVTAHFKHVHNKNCTYDSEPETEEHLKGKIIIRDWLIELFPEAQVEFEYYIKATNQRADVFANLLDGRKIAVEMQCSKIQGSVWKDRHKLYQKAGIQDFWILGQSVHRYGKTDGEFDQDKHHLVSLASTIYKETNSVLFLNTETESIRGLYQHKFMGWHSDTILLFDEQQFRLKDAEVFKYHIATSNIRKEFEDWYKDMIANHKETRPINLAEKHLEKTLEYVTNLTKVHPNLVNTWESDFTSKMYNLLQKGYTLSEKQRNIVHSISKKIEDTLGISLKIDNYS